jgi:hypothetical protein
MFGTSTDTPDTVESVVAVAVTVADVLGVDGLAFFAYKDHVYDVFAVKPDTVA